MVVGPAARALLVAFSKRSKVLNMNSVIKTFDPYEVLDVPRNASFAVIKAAYRKLSKELHPDVGGTPEQWADLKLALDTLIDPKRRKSYDDTGTIEDVKPDNDRAAALQVIEMHFHTLMNEYLTSNSPTTGRLDPFKDPRKRNLTTAIAGKIRDEFIQLKQSIPNGVGVLAFWEDMKTRFVLRAGGAETVNFFTDRIDAQHRSVKAQLAELEQSARVREVALKILDGYEFKFDQPPPTFNDIVANYHPEDYTPPRYTWPR
jgi:curved DNA-binding protein CbpA